MASLQDFFSEDGPPRTTPDWSSGVEDVLVARNQDSSVTEPPERRQYWGR